MQVILGAGGTIGRDLAHILPEFTDTVRLVARNRQKVLPANETFAADLTDANAVVKAVEGADVAYLVVGLPYDRKVWESLWPVIMSNTIAACRAEGCKLVFFDNIYMYDRDHLAPMDENTPVRPTSRKGAVRARIADELMHSAANGDVQALIARSADFYGPGRQANSVLTQTVFERLANGKAAQWLLSLDCPHSFTYTPDAARGTAMLGNTADACGGIWHLPTAASPPTGREWIEKIAAALDVGPKTRLAGDFMLRIMSLFSPTMREIREMAYQYDRDYVFASDKFNRRFDFTPTSWNDGIRAIVDADYR